MDKRLVTVIFLATAAGFWFGASNECWRIWGTVTCAAAAAGLISGWIAYPREKMHVIATGEKEFRLLPQKLKYERFRSVVTPLFIAVFAGIVIAARHQTHFHSWSMGDRDFAECGGGALALLAGYLAYFVAIGRNALEPRVTLTTNQLRLGQPFEIRVDIEAPKAIHIDECRACVRRFEHLLLHYGRYTHLSVKQHGEQIVKLGEGIDLAKGERFSASAQVMLDPATHQASGKSGISMYPFHHWEIQIELIAKHRSTTIFPVTINPLKDAEITSIP